MGNQNDNPVTDYKTGVLDAIEYVPFSKGSQKCANCFTEQSIWEITSILTVKRLIHS